MKTKEIRVHGGYFTKEQCERIKEVLQGKTYMNFDISYSNCGAWNCNLFVKVSDKYSEQEVKDFFFYVALCELAK